MFVISIKNCEVMPVTFIKKWQDSNKYPHSCLNGDQQTTTLNLTL